MNQYLVRHTDYDDYRLYTEFLDKDFRILNTCSQVVVHIVRELADSKLLPYDLKEYSKALGQANEHIKKLLKTDIPPETQG